MQLPGMSELAVVIVGGGPTGMMLAAELALAGVEAVVLERPRSRANPNQERSASGLGETIAADTMHGWR
jgi:3-(3-hydroxy-phenyl)propionate hydroxylase